MSVRQFADSQIIIGRSQDNGLQLDAHGVSLVHAMIEAREGHYFVCDLGSETGTQHLGKNILDQEIHSGESFQVGPFRLEFHVGLPKQASPTHRPPPPPPVESHVQEFSPSQKREESKPAFTTSSSTLGGLEVTGTQQGSAVYKQPPRSLKGTYAPEGHHQTVYNVVKPTTGHSVEVLVVWNERVISTQQFSQTGVITVGSHPNNQVILPVFGSSQIRHPLIKLGPQVFVQLTEAMTVELTNTSGVLDHQSLKNSNRISVSGSQSQLVLNQGEMARVEFGSGLSVIVRFTQSDVKPVPAPLFDFTSSELVGILATFVISAILGLYLIVYSPELIEKEQENVEPMRKAVFVYKQRVKIEDLEAGSREAPREQKKAEDAAKGAASDAPRVQKPSEVVKPTTARAGRDSGIQKGSASKNKKNKESNKASGQKPAKDVTKSGLLSVFGRSGTQAQLRQAERGAGLVGGLGESATGEGAKVAQGAGVVPGLGTRDLGKGGQGESAFGISGVTTKGRGGGVSGYGSGTLGEKGRATVVPGGEGESFVGTIDKEGIRRVVIANKRQIQACYEKALNQEPDLHGKVVLEWDIGAKGKVLGARVKSSTLNSALVEQCMVSHLKSWRFPEPPADQIAVVAFPFVFMSQN